MKLNPLVRRAIAGLALLALPILSGCGGGGGKHTISGTVTYEGNKIESGYVSFFPESGAGQTGGGEIIDGEYTASNVSLGKNKVTVTVTQIANEREGAPPSRAEANRQRLSGLKHSRKPAKTTSRRSVPANAGGNNEVYDITSSTTKLDIHLTKPAQ